MTTEPPRTPGFYIGRIELLACGFEFAKDEGEDLDGPLKESEAVVSVSEHPVEQPSPPVFRHALTVTVRGRTEDGRSWRATTTYGGRFRLEPGSPIDLEQARSIHASAMLYCFAREHIADVIRRTDLPQFILPPMNFVRRAES